MARDRIAPVRIWWRLTYFAVPVHYLCIDQGWVELARVFVPVGVFCLLLVRLVVAARTQGFLETAGITFLGLMLIVYLYSHAVMLLRMPEGLNPTGGSFGLLLFLLILTEGNDIAQAQWGRLLGRRRITPIVSPNKTWEGFLLGAATTTIAAMLLCDALTPLRTSPRLEAHTGSPPYVPALIAGALIAVCGFFGDIIMSAVKREVGVKDSGTLLPGQGGILDRIDSLTFTAPCFYYYVDLLYG
jgi:phosphatidate cytidylyltransferase